MNAIEIVNRTLDFTGPDRVARSFDDSDIAWASYIVASPATDWYEVGNNRWERTDEWGNIWARLDATSKGEIVKGVLAELDAFESLIFPDFSQPASYESVEEARQASPEKYLIGGLPGFTFNVARKLRRLDQYLMDLVTAPTQVHALHDRIDRLIEDMIIQYAARGVDAVMFPEDWGTQQALLIDPALWREEFGPRFRKLCARAHATGIRVWMHSCGYIASIIPDLVDAGISVLQFDQPERYGMDALAAYQAAHPITFWCPVDIQKILPAGDENLIRARAREMIDKLWREGGFIAGYYEDNASIGIDPQWQQIACETFLRYGTQKGKRA